MVRLLPVLRREISDRHRSKQSNIKIQHGMKLGKVAVARWIDEGEKKQPCWEDSPRSGRPCKLNGAQRTAVRRACRKKSTATAVALAFSKHGNPKISRMTVSRLWRSGRRPRIWAKKVVRKRLSPVNKKKRLDFARAYRPTAAIPWAFTDGKVLSLYTGEGGVTHMRWQRVDELDQPNEAGPSKLVARFFIYAVVGRGIKSRLLFTAPSPTRGSGMATGARAFMSCNYVRLMRAFKQELVRWRPSGRYRLIRDRAPQHVSRTSNEAMASLGLPILEPFPPQSWDINAIEFVWAQLTLKLSGHRACTPDGFRRAIMKAWDSISQTTIDQIVAGVSGRMDMIVALEGGWIGACKYDK
jgi:transposase